MIDGSDSGQLIWVIFLLVQGHELLQSDFDSSNNSRTSINSNGGTVRSRISQLTLIRNRQGNERLPGTVLQARARLIERLHGISLAQSRFVLDICLNFCRVKVLIMLRGLYRKDIREIIFLNSFVKYLVFCFQKLGNSWKIVETMIDKIFLFNQAKYYSSQYLSKWSYCWWWLWNYTLWRRGNWNIKRVDWSRYTVYWFSCWHKPSNVP